MRDFIRDIIDQSWTLLGMFVAWIVLEGMAKTVTGWLVIGTTLFWVATYPIRRDKEK